MIINWPTFMKNTKTLGKQGSLGNALSQEQFFKFA